MKTFSCDSRNRARAHSILLNCIALHCITRSRDAHAGAEGGAHENSDSEQPARTTEHRSLQLQGPPVQAGAHR